MEPDEHESLVEAELENLRAKVADARAKTNASAIALQVGLDPIAVEAANRLVREDIDAFLLSDSRLSSISADERAALREQMLPSLRAGQWFSLTARQNRFVASTG